MKLKVVAILAGLFLIGTFFMPGGSSVDVKKIYEEAEKAFQEKRYQEAIDKYKLAIQEGKKFGANTKVIDEDFDSLASFKIATAYSKLGEQLDDPTKYEESLKYIPEIYENTQTSKVKEGVIFLWGINLYQLERYEEAEPKLRELINDYPDSRALENAYYTLGRLYYELKQYESSREAFKMVISKYPNSEYVDDSQYFIGKCFFDELIYDQAHLEFEKVQSENKEFLAQAKYYDALSLLRMGRNQEALIAYQKFIAGFPESPFMTATYYDMGVIHSKLREYDEATRYYEQAIQSAKDDLTRGEIQYQIGVNYQDQEDYQSAINAYRALMEKYPENVNIPKARFFIAECYWAMKDYQNALQAYSEVLDKDPQGTYVVESIYKIGECNYQLGNKELALEWYQKVIDNYSDSPLVKDAIYGKLWALNDLKRFEEAEQVGRDYINKYKKDPVYDIAAAETQMKLGDVKFDAENFIPAADEYLLVVSDYSDLPKFDPFKSRSLLQAGYAYYSEAERNNWDASLLQKSVDAYVRLLDQYEKNFDKEKREFENRTEYVTSGIINLGITYSKLKEYDKSIAVLRGMPKNNPEYGRAWYLIGQTYADAGRSDDAINHYRGMVNDKSLSATWRSRAAIELASKLRDAGRHSEAIVEYQRIVEEYSTSEYVATAQYYVGSSYYDIEPKTPENMDKAIEAFQKVLTQYSRSEAAPWAYLGILKAYGTKGSYDMVIKTAEEIEQQYADSGDAEVKRVIDLARREKVDAMQRLEAGMSADVLIAELRKIVDNPLGEEEGKAAAQMRIGLVLFNEKRYAESIKEYETLLDRFPGKFTGAAYYQIAASAFWVDDYQKAVTSAQKGLAVPDLSQEVLVGLHYTSGLAYAKLGNINDEISALEQAVKAGAGSDKEQIIQILLSSRRELARVYVSTRQYEEAAKQYEYLGENQPTPAEKADAYFWGAKLYEENLQNYQKAVDYYAKVKELNASDLLTAQSLYFEGVLYSKSLKNSEKGLSSFTELVDKYGASTDSNVQQMVADTRIRIPELLVELGKFDDAIATARKARDEALASDSKEDKVNAQYQLAYLLGDRASKAAESGSPNQAFSKEAVAEFAKVYDLAKPINELPSELQPMVAASLYNAGHLLYTLGGYDNYVDATSYFEQFVREFQKNENYSAVLQLVGFTTYEMARLKADLAVFEKAAQYFARFAREFPTNKDAAASQYQAGEAYFTIAGGHTVENRKSAAVEAYRKASAAYRVVVDKWPSSEFAADSLYGLAACHAYIAEALSDPKELDKMNDAYSELAEKFPKSKYAAVAFEAVGNSYYNQAVAPNVSEKQRDDLLKQALRSYRQGLQVPGIETKTKMSLEGYIRETEDLLAQGPYSEALRLVPYESTNIEQKKANAPRAIQLLNEVISSYPNTDAGELSFVQLGLCYELLERWDDAVKAYGRLMTRYTDAKGNPIVPFSENVVAALQFAKDRRNQIMAYQASIKAVKQSGQ